MALANSLIDIAGLFRATGQPNEAMIHVSKAEAILGGLTDPDNYSHYLTARMHALYAALVGRGQPPHTPEGEAERRLHAGRAIEALRRAIAAGYNDKLWMTRDPELDPLRARADFQALIMDLEFPADPFSKNTDADH
jgi:hypothetical protein